MREHFGKYRLDRGVGDSLAVGELTASPAAAMRLWARGYARARGYSEPRFSILGAWMPTGAPERAGRHVFAGFYPGEVARLAREIGERDVHLEVPAPRELVEPLLPAGWRVRERAWLMVGLPPRERFALPPGYSAVIEHRSGSMRAAARCGGGEEVARAVLAVAGEACILDQVETHPGHRRLGLGRALVGALHVGAAARGAPVGVLIATPQGRGLYRRMGWRDVSEVCSAVRATAADASARLTGPAAP